MVLERKLWILLKISSLDSFCCEGERGEGVVFEVGCCLNELLTCCKDSEKEGFLSPPSLSPELEVEKRWWSGGE